MSYRPIEKQVVYRGKRLQFEVHRLESEETGETATRELCVHPGSVVILPFLSKDEVVLIKNHRYAVGQLLVELPAGTLRKGEDPINCAGRELAGRDGISGRAPQADRQLLFLAGYHDGEDVRLRRLRSGEIAARADGGRGDRGHARVVQGSSGDDRLGADSRCQDNCRAFIV